MLDRSKKFSMRKREWRLGQTQDDFLHKNKFIEHVLSSPIIPEHMLPLHIISE